MHPLHYFPLFNTYLVLITTGFCPTFTAGRQLCTDKCPPTMYSLISEMSRHSTTIIIVHDEYNEYSTKIIMDIGYDHLFLIYEYRSFFGFLNHHIKWKLKTVSLSEARKHLSFILIGGSSFAEKILQTASEMDNTVGQRTLLRHFSTWLIICPDHPPHLNITLDNVALLIPKEKNWNTPINFWTNLTTEAYTLLWMPKGREWLHVFPCDLQRDFLYITIFPNTLKGLNGRQLVLVTLEWLPSTKRQIINGEVKYVGAAIDVIDNLAMTFNFRVMEPPDMKWGDEAQDGNWTGVVGVLQREEADMCPVPYGITLSRAKVMDLSYPVSITEVSALYIKRVDDKLSWLFLLSCFTWQVYLCGSIAFMWIILLLMFSHYCHKRTSTDPWRVEEILATSIRIGIPIVFRQDINPRHVQQAGRIVMFTWCVFCLLVAAVYTGNLVAMATQDKLKPPFTTLQELVENKEYEVGVLEGDYTVELLRLSNDTIHQALYKKMMKFAKKGNDESFEYKLGRLFDMKYVLLAGANIMNILRNRTCDMVVMKESLFPLNKGFAFPRHSALKKMFDQQFAGLKDNGLIYKLEKKWTPKPKECDSPDHIPQFKLDHFRIVLVTCSAGILVAAMVLLVEIWKKK